MTPERRPKGTGSIREREGKYQATYSFNDATGKRRRRSKLFRTKTAARSWLNERIAETQTGRHADAGHLTVGQYISDWVASLDGTGLEPTTLSWYRSAAIRHIIPKLGSVKLTNLSPVMIEAFLLDQKARGRLDGNGGLGPSSVRRLQVTLHKALDAALRKGMLARNPVDLAETPRMPEIDATAHIWTSDELAQFVSSTSENRLAGIWRTAAMTGLRRSEICGLTWPDVDLDRGVLSIRQAAVVVNGRRHVKLPKTSSSRRTVELDDGTTQALRAWRKDQLQERLRAGEAWHEGQWVVTDELGAPINPEWFSDLFLRHAEEAGLPRMTLRQLRHSHATALLQAGVHPKVVQERLGHSSIRVTMDVYSAVLPNMQREAVELLAQTFDSG
ncbi:MAG: tyrosine-type recombinase/integrase [Acidimicrobiia bacterium]